MVEAGQSREGGSRRRPLRRDLRPIDHILVSRLIELYDPWENLGLSKEDFADYDIVQETFSANDRDWDYDMGRVNFFADRYRRGLDVTPIVLDNYCNGFHIYPVPTIIDGHHRLCGADLAGVQKIASSYSGRVDLLRYLKGLRKTKPE